MIVVSFDAFFISPPAYKKPVKVTIRTLVSGSLIRPNEINISYNARVALPFARNKVVQLIILIRMRTPSSQFRLVELRQRCWDGSIRNTEDIIHSIITRPVLHHRLTVHCKVHHLQTFTLLVVGIGSLRAVTEFRIDRMTLFLVTNLINNKIFTSTYSLQVDKNL